MRARVKLGLRVTDGVIVLLINQTEAELRGQQDVAMVTPFLHEYQPTPCPSSINPTFSADASSCSSGSAIT